MTMTKTKTTIDKEYDRIIIRGLKDTELISLEVPLTEAIKDKKQIYVHINSDEPNEIVKGTYVAKSISTSGYACHATISKDKNEMDWVCEPPHLKPPPSIK